MTRLKGLLYIQPFWQQLAEAADFFLIEQYGIGISTATLVAAVIIGFLGLYMANKLRCSMEVVSFPALLPMIPGLYAYETILSIVKYSKAVTIADKQAIIVCIFDNGITTLSIITALAVGVTIPLLVFYEKSFTMTRKKKAK